LNKCSAHKTESILSSSEATVSENMDIFELFDNEAGGEMNRFNGGLGFQQPVSTAFIGLVSAGFNRQSLTAQQQVGAFLIENTCAIIGIAPWAAGINNRRLEFFDDLFAIRAWVLAQVKTDL